MLKIAAIGNNHTHIKHFVEFKFKDKIEKKNDMTQTYYLKNGDSIHLCYEESNKERYLSMIYDAFIVAPGYVSLLDTIRHRCERP